MLKLKLFYLPIELKRMKWINIKISKCKRYFKYFSSATRIAGNFDVSVLQITSGVALEVLDLALGVWDDGVTAGGPVGGANLSVFIGELEGLNKSQSFINGPVK